MSSLGRLLHIKHPILQSGMGRVAGPDLTAAVSRAGGLGILAGLNLTPDEMRRQIRQVRSLTDRPFGVNLWLHPELRPPVDPSAVPAADIASANDAINRTRRELALPLSNAAPERRPDTIAATLDVILEERVAVWSIGLGVPTPEMIAGCRDRDVKVMVMVANVDDAREAERVGADIIVAQGSEAGGHRSTWRRDAPAGVGTLALVPEIVDAVGVPVVAAGGIADGRGLVAALALGAQGVLMGTRFVATRESAAPDFWKQRILASCSDNTMVTAAFTGLPARVIRNRFAEDYGASRAAVLPGLLQASVQQDVWAKAIATSNAEYYPLFAGQSVGVIHDLPSAADVVDAIANEAESILKSLRSLA